MTAPDIPDGFKLVPIGYVPEAVLRSHRGAMDRAAQTEAELRGEVGRLRALADNWRADSAEEERRGDAARTEAATRRTAIERLVDEYGGWPNDLERDVRSALAARPAPEADGCDGRCDGVQLHPGDARYVAPEAAPPTLTVTREQVAAASTRQIRSLLSMSQIEPMLNALGVTVVDAEADR